MGGSIVVLAENRGSGHFNAELTFESKPPGKFRFSRLAPQTSDWLAPGFGQLFQIALPEYVHTGSIGWSSSHKFSMSMWRPKPPLNVPDIGTDSTSIHAPFRLDK